MAHAQEPRTYDAIGQTYRRHRAPDPRIGARILEALRGARKVCNVGAGAGAYEPADCWVVPVEPSRTMIVQRARPAGVQAVAEELPFVDGCFDAAMAVLTVHHWRDAGAGLAEMRRVSKRQVVLAFEPCRDFWLERDYVPALGDYWRHRMPSVREIAERLSATAVEPVPVPWNCTDGFQTAYWRRPEKYLDPEVRASISTWQLLSPNDVEPGLSRLAEDLRSGEWARRNAELLHRDKLDLGYRLVIAGE